MSEPVLPPGIAARFRVEGKLGRGGAGVVYRAIQVELNRPVAVKVLHREVLAEPSLVERFISEAKITAQLTHPSIVRILDHGVDNDIPWIAYEFLPGPTLRQHLAPGPLNWTEALTIAVQVAGALETAHAAGVLHRDVKPDNVLGAGANRWKVTDFGIAKRTGFSLDATQSGLLMGTPAYLAPEHITSGTAEPASDLYALGVTLFEMLTGKRPFADANPVRLLEKHLTLEVPAPSSMAAGIPSAVDALVLRALAKTPADRWSSCGDFRAAMIEVLGPDASVDMSKLEVEAGLSRSGNALRLPEPAINRSGTNVPIGHLPPLRSAGGASPDGVRDFSGSNFTMPPEVSQTPPTPVSARASRGPRDASRSFTSVLTRHAAAPLAAVGLLLVAVGALLWPRPHGPRPAPSSTPAPVASAGAGLPGWEAARMRAELKDLLKARDARDTDVKVLASYLVPALPEFAKARELGLKLVKDETAALAAMQHLCDRMTEEYPSADRVPDDQVVLYARVFVNRARAWCWLENTRITLEHTDKALAAGAQVGTSAELDEMTKAPYPPGVVVPLFAALDAVGGALDRIARGPHRIDAELTDFFVELNFAAVNVAWREWGPTTWKYVAPRIMKLREVCAQLKEPVGPALGRVAMALWDLGSAPGSQWKSSRERLLNALRELGGFAALAPALPGIVEQVQDQILTAH